jgi:hypothetical protein
LRGWVLLRHAADRPWVKRPAQTELKQALQEFRAGAWSPSVADQVHTACDDGGVRTVSFDVAVR